MIRIRNIKLSPKESKDQILHKACKKIRLSESQVKSFSICKESLDARNKGNIFFIYTVDIEVNGEDKILRTNKNPDVSHVKKTEYKLPHGKVDSSKRPVVVGFGPAGLFCALTLCQLGFKPIVLERGKEVDERLKDVERFWETGELNTSSNVQFGEGGAGTFSDGKLTARSKDTRSSKVFKEFLLAGAPEEIGYAHNPHIGTDKLREVVKNIRLKIIEMGGEVRFNSQVTDLGIENGNVVSVTVNNKETINCSDVVLALGHSARDTFEKIHERNVAISPKPFAVGARIEHLQEDINKAQYGDFFAEESLGAAEYKLTHTTSDGRGTYTFCMCPGGYVVGASSEEGRVCVNGMSYHDRQGENANSAVLVQVRVDDFEKGNPLVGMEFQRQLEEKAFVMGGSNYNAPTQKLGGFLGIDFKDDKSVVQTYKPNTVECDLNELFPDFVSKALKEGITAMGKRMKGFDNPNSILTGVESRSSSPIRIERDLRSLESINVSGLYPTGEGAGYAGGIVSASIDGIAVAEKIFEKYMI